MGAGIAQVALQAGHVVRLHDVDPAAFDRARERIADSLTRRAERAGLEPPAITESVARTLDRLRPARDLDAVADGADLVIEAALEELGLKRRIFVALDHAAPAGAILATNTSALSVDAIGAAANDRSRIIGLHFFNPAPQMALVEVVHTAASEPWATERAIAFMTAWGKTPVRCADSPGFIVNRVNRPFTLEALSLVEAGVASVPQVDGALRAAGFPMGPFELMDLIGVDINLAAATGLYEAMGRALRFRPSPIQEQLVAAGQLGRKTGAGFYRYDETGRAIGPTVGLEDTDAPGTPDAEIAERIVLAVVNEAFSAAGDEVATEPDIDRALRLGAGHPVGPFERVAGLGGPAGVAARLRGLARAGGPRFEPSALLADLR